MKERHFLHRIIIIVVFIMCLELKFYYCFMDKNKLNKYLATGRVKSV